MENAMINKYSEIVKLALEKLVFSSQNLIQEFGLVINVDYSNLGDDGLEFCNHVFVLYKGRTFKTKVFLKEFKGVYKVHEIHVFDCKEGCGFYCNENHGFRVIRLDLSSVLEFDYKEIEDDEYVLIPKTTSCDSFKLLSIHIDLEEE